MLQLSLRLLVATLALMTLCVLADETVAPVPTTAAPTISSNPTEKPSVTVLSPTRRPTPKRSRKPRRGKNPVTRPTTPSPTRPPLTNCPKTATLLNSKGKIKQERKECPRFEEGLTCTFTDEDFQQEKSYVCKFNKRRTDKKWKEVKIEYVALPLNNVNDDDRGPDLGLGLCEGDCNSDEECQEGLRCFIRDSDSSSVGIQVPGCINGEEDPDTTAYDYCVDPKYYACENDEKVCVDPNEEDTSTCEATTCAKLFLEYPDKCFCDFYSARCRQTCGYCRATNAQKIRRCELTSTTPFPEDLNGKLCASTPSEDCTSVFCEDSLDKIPGQKSLNRCSKLDTPKKVEKQCKKETVQLACPVTCQAC